MKKQTYDLEERLLEYSVRIIKGAGHMAQGKRQKGEKLKKWENFRI